MLDINEDKKYIDNRVKVRLVVGRGEFSDVRCACGALLYRILGKSKDTKVEIKCRRCGKVSTS